MVSGHLIEAMCRALDHKVASFKLLFDCLWKLVHLIEIDGPPASVIGVVVSHKIRQHALDCMEMQVPDTISLSTSEQQQGVFVCVCLCVIVYE